MDSSSVHGEHDRTPQAVRFSSVNEEIQPEIGAPASRENRSHESMSPAAEEEIRTLTKNIHAGRCQARRLEMHSFEPVSLPTSRAPSPSARTSSNHSIPGSSKNRASPYSPAVDSPPLTPAGTSLDGGSSIPSAEQQKQSPGAAHMTPEHEAPPTTVEYREVPRESEPSPELPAANRDSPRALSLYVPDVVAPHPRHPPTFTVGPTGDSVPPSRDISPSGTPGNGTPGNRTPNRESPGASSRPHTPAGDRDDPYARSKRAPQGRGPVDARFIFNARDRRGHGHTSSSASEGFADSAKEERKHGFFSSSKRQTEAQTDESDGRSIIGKQHHHGSMSELKRFFKLGGSKHAKSKPEKSPKPKSVASSARSSMTASRKGNVMTPPTSHGGSSSIPFADDHGLQSKYGQFGKVLGSGAGGSVRLMKRSHDGKTFAVKQFRARHSYESEKDYVKKVTAEFCIGSTLHNGNVIETMDLVHEKGNYYVVMEYAPFDLFAITMTGKMGREEISCATLQILNGVNYLHSVGLAHRDLKLDNVVVNEHGIMKIIDFGSAIVFRYPFETGIVLASGIVGSDPYLAPEVYDNSKYDPQPTDIWSLAIIFCCMTLRRFPWKQPRLSDNSYKLFVSKDDRSTSELPPASRSEPTSRNPTSDPHTTHSEIATNGNRASENDAKPAQPVIKGPWRLLRLLPRETRHIIGRMLEIDPKKRATLEEIYADPWVNGSQVCSQDENGDVSKAMTHEHTLVPGNGVGSAPTTRQEKR